MGRRKPTTGSGGAAFSRNSLFRHIESCELTSPSVDQIVDYLRSTYPHYSRQKVQPLTRQVEKTLKLINFKNPKRPRTFEYQEDDESDEGPEFEIKKISNLSEEKLQRLEAQHIAKTRAENESLTGTTDDDSDSDDEEELSSSEDGIYGEELSPKIDLMKDILREKYIDKIGSSSKKNGKDGNESKVVNNNNNSSSNSMVRKKIELMKRRKVEVELVSNKREEKGEEGGLERSKGPMFKDLGGMDGVIEDLIMDFIVPLYHPELPRHLGVKPMGGILLNGPPGCGKTKLAHAIANETGVPFYSISATELVSGISGASEENIRELFSKAYRTSPSIVFIDEIDAIASKRENMQREMERRIVTQLMTCMDESHKPVQQPSDINALSEGAASQPGYILVIGATNRPDAVDPALRRPGRFDREITLGVPDETARIDILSKLTSKLKLEGAFDLLKIARSTPGFVGADLAALTFKAGNLAMKRLFDQRKSQFLLTDAGDHDEDWWRQPWSPEEIGKLSINMADFEEAVKQVQPSSRREGFSAIPNIKWEDVGGLDLRRLEFDSHIVQSIKNPKLYADFGINTEIGFLLYGPPGCGKTLIAKAVANEAGANFIHIKGPELLNKYVGESELAVRTIFSRARTCSPCVLFFDEVDALTARRGREGGQVVERLVTQLLIELDGAEKRKGVFVIGATNRPEIMDPAFLRPGRFGKLLYVPLPTPDERGMILKALVRKKPIDADVDLMAIANDSACGNLSGADLAALLNEAAMVAVQEEQTLGDSSMSSPRTIKDRHFKVALQKIAPSVSDKQRQHYDLLSQRFGLCSVPNKSEGEGKEKENRTGYVYVEQSQPKP